MNGIYHYHFEVFALDTTLSLKPEKATHNAVADAMKGHVFAEGEAIGKNSSLSVQRAAPGRRGASNRFEPHPISRPRAISLIGLIHASASS